MKFHMFDHIREDIRKNIREAFINLDAHDRKPHRFISNVGKELNHKEWAKADSPRQFKLVEIHWTRCSDSYSVYVFHDTGHGGVWAFNTKSKTAGCIVGSTNTLILGEVVILDKEYFNVDKYVWE